MSTLHADFDDARAYVPKKLLPQIKLQAVVSRIQWPSQKVTPTERMLFRPLLIVLDHNCTPDRLRSRIGRAMSVGNHDGVMTESDLPIDRAVRSLNSARRLGRARLLDAHRALCPDEGMGGKLRDGMAVLRCDFTGAVTYVPPPARHLQALVDDLAAFASGEQGHPLAQAFIALLQLLLVHPFADGNGRTARALFASLCERRGFAHPVALLALARMYAGGAMRLHAGSAVLRSHRDWQPYLQYCAQDAGAAASAWNIWSSAHGFQAGADGFDEKLPASLATLMFDAMGHGRY